MNTLRILLVLALLLTCRTPCAETAPASLAGLQPLVVYQEAMSYLLGRNGKPKSAEKAAALLQTLADQNWCSAQHMLGFLYYEGKGVEQNDLLAYKWLSLAARNSAPLAEAVNEKRLELQSRLPSESLQQVDMWIAEWRPVQ